MSVPSPEASLGSLFSVITVVHGQSASDHSRRWCPRECAEGFSGTVAVVAVSAGTASRAKEGAVEVRRAALLHQGIVPRGRSRPRNG